MIVGRAASRCGAAVRRLPGLAREHRLFSVLFVLGLLGRILTMTAYWPSLFYIDSLGYLTNRFTLNPTAPDPIGYPIILRALLDLHELSLVVGIQHLLGLAMAVCVYALLLRKGAPRWLGALAAAPVLLDAYEWQIEQNILSDSVFLAMLTIALTLLAWNRRPSWKTIVAVGLVLGCACVVRSIGEIVILPVVVYLLIVAGPRARRRLASAGLLALVFVLPILANLGYTDSYTDGNVSTVESSQNLLYGRLATVADCAAMPSDLRVLCPSGSLAYRQSLGPDYYAHDSGSPVNKIGTGEENAFDDWVLEHQPLAVAQAVGGDFVELFISPHSQFTGATPVSRWQFQTAFPVWSANPKADTNATDIALAGGSGSGHLDVGLAQGLRDYQLDGGYTPPWYYAVAFLAALGGLFGATRRARGSHGKGSHGKRLRGIGSRGNGLRAQILLWAGTGTALLLGADLFEFSWRYQLPALVLLPLGGAFGVMNLFNLGRDPRPLLAEYPDAVDAEAARDFHERHGDNPFQAASVVVVIAAYNEADGIGAVLEKLPAECRGLSVAPLVVVDGATDETARVALAHGAPTCIAPRNRGQGAALRLGYQLAYASGAQYIVTTDADGQYDTAELPRLLEPILSGEADFVTGSRILGGNESGDRVRQAGCRFFAAVVSLLMHRRVTDTSFGLRAMHAKAAVSVNLQQPQYQSSELLISIMAQGFRVAEVPMTIAARGAGRTKKGNNLVYGLRYARVVLGTWRRERRSAKTQRSKSTNLAMNTTP